MSQPEALLWKNLKESLPSHWQSQRIENRAGGGVPDVYLCAEGISFWVELKVTKTNAVKVSAFQHAWNYAHHRAGGINFYLVSPLEGPNLYLFAGDQGKNLMTHGIKSNGSGPVVPCLWSGSGFGDLVPRMLAIARERLSKYMIESSWVGVGDQSGSGSGLDDSGRGNSGLDS